MSLNNYSLRRRLLLSATLLLVVFLGLMGLALNNAFEKSVLSNAEDALRNQILLLMANVDVIDGKVEMPQAVSEARLSQTDSSLFAQLDSAEGDILWRSESLMEMNMPDLPSGAGEFKFFEFLDWPQGPTTFAMSLGVVWETEQGDLPFTVQVSESTQAYVKRLKRYQRQLMLWLGGLGITLLVILLALLSWGLSPLARVARQVRQIEQGERRRFDEDYPMEVSRLTQNLNQLLNFEEQRITRQKEVLGNLAHSLKTPIAVMKGLQYRDANRAEADKQLGAMQNIIEYQLQSASAVGRRRFAKPIDIRKPTQQVVDSLNKLHQGKQLEVSVSIADDLQFFGDQGDWMELAGNLLDNAFKWAASSVSITVEARHLDSHRMAVVLEVADDGAGIDPQLKATILQRGVRLDTQTPGHGLGLHIVKGIVEAYDGELKIEDAEPTGTIFKVRLN